MHPILSQENMNFEAAYRDPKHASSFGGVDSLKRTFKVKGKDVKQWLETKDSYTLHKPIRRNFLRNRVLVSNINEQFQVDLVDMQSLAKINRDYKYILTCIDIVSKFAWAIPLKDKSGKSVKSALETIFKEKTPRLLQSDSGTELTNSLVQSYLKKMNVKFFTTKNETKASIVERFNRTLKTKMWKYFTEFNTKKYIDVIPDFIHSYNHTFHRSIKMEPASVNSNNKNEVLENLYGNLKNLKRKPPTFKVGDTVRISRQKLHFEKGYEQNWSREIFTVNKIIERIPIVYRLKDMSGEDIEGTFYEAELQKVVDSGFYPVEKVIKKKKKQGVTEYFVKFLGYPDKFNAWVTDVKIL